MKRLFCLLFFCMACLSAGAQWKWQNPMDAGFPVVQNQGWPGREGNKTRRMEPLPQLGRVSDPLL